MSWVVIGLILNVIFFFIHIYFCDKDPTHEDVVILIMLALCVCPYLLVPFVVSELITQKIFHIHHGVKRK